MKTKTSPLKIKSPKMRKSLNSSSERQFVRGSSLNIQKKSPRKKTKSPVVVATASFRKRNSSKKSKSPTTTIPQSAASLKKLKSPMTTVPQSATTIKKKGSFGNSLTKLEDRVKTLYGPREIFDLPSSTDFIPSQPISKIQPKPKAKVCNSKCNILTNQCYIDCVNYITTNISEYTKNPNELVDDLFVMIEPRMNKDVYIQNINTANLYNNMVEYTSQKWTDDDIKTIKTLIKSVKDNIHYKPVKMFLKEVKFYKYYK